MPPVQTTYDRNPVASFAGLLYDLRDNVIESYAAEGAAGIGLGLALVAGTDPDKQVKLPTGEGLEVRGISVHQYALEQAADGTVEYAEKDTVNTLRRGMIWVQTTGTFTRDTAAFFKISGADAGKFTSADDATTDPFPTAVFRGSGSGGALGLVEINLPGGVESPS